MPVTTHFRQFATVSYVRNVDIVADIEGAFLQISIAPEDRNYLRFLWYQDIKNNELVISKFRYGD